MKVGYIPPSDAFIGFCPCLLSPQSS